MERSGLEVADIFHAHAPAWRQAQHCHLSLGQFKAMSAIEQCRSAALAGHELRCQACEHTDIAYNSCRNRHCPKRQDGAARRWLRSVSTSCCRSSITVSPSPGPHRSPRSHGTTRRWSTICCSRPRHGRCMPSPPIRSTWAYASASLWCCTHGGSALTHHPHVHGIVSGGGLAQARALGRLQIQLLPAGTRAFEAISPTLSGSIGGGPRCRPAAFLRLARAAGGDNGLGELADAATALRMGGLCPAAICRSRNVLGPARWMFCALSASST